MKISVVMIVKNEEEMLPRCLDSVKGFDELIVVDTGSDDRTVEIAKQYTDNVYFFAWCDSFAKARNFAKQYATGDWILSIDADEVLKTPIETVYSLTETEEELLNVRVTSKLGGTHLFPRIFRNKKDIYWKGDIHNYLSKTAKGDSGVEIVYDYSPAHKKDPDRALRILTRVVEEKPESVRERYYLAREYFYRGKWQECINELDKYIKVATWIPERNDAWLMRARCLANIRRYGEACDSAWQAIKYDANFKEALEFIGNHMDPVNKERWLQFSSLANNRYVLFSRETEKKPMDLRDEHIDYIKGIFRKFDSVDVLEWGSGYSTQYFPKFLKDSGIKYTWRALEHNPFWASVVGSWGVENLTLVLSDKDSKEYLKPSGKFDVIFIDGRNRSECLSYARTLLKRGGYIVLHDAQRGRYSAEMSKYKGEFIGTESPRLWVSRGKLT